VKIRPALPAVLLLVGVLAGCTSHGTPVPAAPDAPLISSSPAAPLPAVSPSADPSPIPQASLAGPVAPVAPDQDSRPSPASNVRPGAYCPTLGQLGYTPAGTLMRCSATEQDPRLRWRRA
jgi:hypothetical protein